MDVDRNRSLGHHHPDDRGPPADLELPQTPPPSLSGGLCTFGAWAHAGPTEQAVIDRPSFPPRVVGDSVHSGKPVCHGPPPRYKTSDRNQECRLCTEEG